MRLSNAHIGYTTCCKTPRTVHFLHTIAGQPAPPATWPRPSYSRGCALPSPEVLAGACGDAKRVAEVSHTSCFASPDTEGQEARRMLHHVIAACAHESPMRPRRLLHGRERETTPEAYARCHAGAVHAAGGAHVEPTAHAHHRRVVTRLCLPLASSVSSSSSPASRSLAVSSSTFLSTFGSSGTRANARL